MSASIPALAARSFAESEQAGHIILYAADSVEEVIDDPFMSLDSADESTSIFKQFVHVVPALADKPAVPPRTPDLTRIAQGKRDVFAGPEFGTGEKIMDLKQGAREYALVHNLHALFTEHFMLVPHFPSGEPFRPQTSDLLADDLACVWKVVDAYAKEGRECVCFFNGGPLAGASQSHLHLQFTPFQHSVPPACEALARALRVPSISSSASTFPPTPSRLPVPWVHFCLPLPPSLQNTPTSSSSTSLSPTASQDLYNSYQSLLSASRSFLDTVEEAALPSPGPKRESYNLFMTSQFMHLIPRTDRLVKVPRVASSSSSSTLPSAEKKEEEQGEDRETFTLSLNGLLYLSYFFVGSEAEKEDLKRHGLGRTLREGGYKNEEFVARE
ncbi:hypothetical protein JCM11641_004969 [Rhodosporidiobolus odoratus]